MYVPANGAKCQLYNVLCFRKSAQNQKKLREATNAVRRACRNDRLCREQAVLNAKDNAAFFRYVNSQISSKGSIPVLKNRDGTRCLDPKSKAEALNNQFASVFTVDDGRLPPFENKNVETLDALVITEESVFEALKLQPAKTSVGPDKIPPILLKKCAQGMSLPLTKIFQRSVDTGVLPTDWLDAVVVPIFKKKGSNSAPENYRPVSLTSPCCKVLETLFKKRILDHLLKFGLLTELQHGFLASKSTLTNTLTCLDKWFKAVDDGKVVHSVFLDFAKAFDTVSHPKLLHKVSAYGIRGNVLAWLESLLSNRSQRVRVGNTFSVPVNVTSGVPQGTVLGPLLFLLYINDLPDVIKTVSAFFADDCKLFTICDKSVVSDPKMGESLKLVHQWATTWQLSLSVPKCTVFIFGHPKVPPNYRIGDHILETRSDVSDLGVLLSETAKSSNHCLNISNKGLQMVSMIFRNFSTRNRQFLCSMFNVYVLPVLSYNSPVWSPYLLKDIRRVERVLRTFTRRIPGLSGLTYKDRLATLKMCSLEESRIRSDLILCYRVLNNLVCLDSAQFFTQSTETRTRGHPLKLYIPPVNHDYSKYFFSNRVPKIWNALPCDVVMAPSLTLFKKRLQAVDLSAYIRGFDTI
jgi:hypothetical protein